MGWDRVVEEQNNEEATLLGGVGGTRQSIPAVTVLPSWFTGFGFSTAGGAAAIACAAAIVASLRVLVLGWRWLQRA